VSERVGVAVIGRGFGERVHVPGFQLLEASGVQIVGVAGRDGWRELVAADTVDLVSVATPPASHREIVETALRHGRAVLCEKPLAESDEAARTLQELADAAGVPTLVDFTLREVDVFREAARTIRAGEIGRVRDARVTWHLSTRLDQTLPWSWKDDADAGGGALLSFGIHAVDYVSWLVGPVVAVEGRLLEDDGVRTGADGRARPVTSDAGFEGTLYTVACPVSFSVSTIASEARHDVVVRGDAGTLVIENRDMRDHMRAFALTRETAADGVQEVVAADGDGATDGRIAPFARMAARLVDAIRSNGRCDPSFADGARAQRVADGMLRAGRTGERVELDESV
jgi:predicted dehydrogenase